MFLRRRMPNTPADAGPRTARRTKPAYRHPALTVLELCAILPIRDYASSIRTVVWVLAEVALRLGSARVAGEVILLGADMDVVVPTRVHPGVLLAEVGIWDRLLGVAVEV